MIATLGSFFYRYKVGKVNRLSKKSCSHSFGLGVITPGLIGCREPVYDPYVLLHIFHSKFYLPQYM